MCSIHSAVCTSFAWHFIGGSLGVQHSLCGLYKLCMAFYRWHFGCAAFTLRSVQAFAWHFIGGSLGVQHSLCGLHKLCMAFYRW